MSKEESKIVYGQLTDEVKNFVDNIQIFHDIKMYEVNTDINKFQKENLRNSIKMINHADQNQQLLNKHRLYIIVSSLIMLILIFQLCQ